MLVAKRENDVRISLAHHWEKRDLTAIRSREKFFCQECNEEVILKLGNKKIWHFAHKPGNVCLYEHEHESNYHLSGKLQLYHWLLEQGISAELEKYDPIAKQKPDIVFSYQRKKYAVEFQCAIIPEDVFIKRTETYKENGYIPIWIAGETLIKRTGTHIVSLNSYLYLFMRTNNPHPILTAFCPLSSQLLHLHHTVPVSPRKTITHIAVNSLPNAQLKDLINPDFKKASFVTLWQKEIQKYKSNYLKYPEAKQNDFLQELYRNRLPLLHLPPEIGIPVPSAYFIETAPFIWQSYLYLDLLRKLKTGSAIRRQDFHRTFTKRMNRGMIQPRKIPMAERGDYKQAVDEYISLLSLLSVLVKSDSDEFRLIKDLSVPATTDGQHEKAGRFYKEFGRVIESFFKIDMKS